MDWKRYIHITAMDRQILAYLFKMFHMKCLNKEVEIHNHGMLNSIGEA